MFLKRPWMRFNDFENIALVSRDFKRAFTEPGEDTMGHISELYNRYFMQACMNCWSKAPKGKVGCRHTMSKDSFSDHLSTWPAYRVASFLRADGKTYEPYNLPKSFIYVYGSPLEQFSNCPSHWHLAFASHSISECRTRRLRYALNYANLRYHYFFPYIP